LIELARNVVDATGATCKAGHHKAAPSKKITVLCLLASAVCIEEGRWPRMGLGALARAAAAFPSRYDGFGFSSTVRVRSKKAYSLARCSCARVWNAQQESVLSRSLLLCTCLEWSFSAECDSLGQTSGARVPSPSPQLRGLQRAPHRLDCQSLGLSAASCCVHLCDGKNTVRLNTVDGG
jgi:hypothetical protein